MSIHVLDGKRFADMIIQSANHLSNHAKMIDALNVFPVPDGDTGTNMNLSMTSGAKEVRQSTTEHIGMVGMALAKGLLMGARGNSGVILSQLFRGFSKAIENKSQITSIEFAHALESGVETAYKAVIKPVEGTILTVAKDAAKHAFRVAKTNKDLIIVMEETLHEARKSLKRTPDLLPVLKEVGVVDSGGQGLVLVYEGFLASLKGEVLPEVQPEEPKTIENIHHEHYQALQGHIRTEDIKFGYCTEFMVKFESDKISLHPFVEEQFRLDLSHYGDSLLVVSDPEVVKVHIHSEQPGEVLSYGQRYGSLINMKIENMRQQHHQIVNEEKQVAHANEMKKKETYGIITVAMGNGISNLFKSIGANVVIEGGQTMNPSTEDIVNAIKEVNAENIFILPNNKNIIMASEQAASLSEENVIVIPSKTIPQGMSALLAFNPESNDLTNQTLMTDALLHVKSGQVTFSVRDTNIDGFDIVKDDYMGIADGKIVAVHSSMLQAAKELLSNMVDEDDEILTILQGESVRDEEVEELVSMLEEQFENLEIEVHRGDQPIYSFIFSIE